MLLFKKFILWSEKKNKVEKNIQKKTVFSLLKRSCYIFNQRNLSCIISYKYSTIALKISVPST